MAVAGRRLIALVRLVTRPDGAAPIEQDGFTVAWYLSIDHRETVRCGSDLCQ